MMRNVSERLSHARKQVAMLRSSPTPCATSGSAYVRV